MPVRVGYAESDITPPLGGSMPGYFRDRISTGILDPLRAKILTLNDGKTTLVIVALDLIGLEAAEVGLIREAIRREAGIPPGQVFIHATHTHTGAMVPRRFTSDAGEIYPGIYPGQVDQEWLGRLPTQIASATDAALARQVAESAATLGIGREESVAFYRRYFMKDGTLRTNPGRGNPNIVRPAGEIDPAVYTLSFETAKVLLVSYGLHPDCIGGTQYSADYPYHLTEALREALGSEWKVLFLNATCGNINHVNVKDPGQRSSYQESRRIGRTLAQAALQARTGAQEVSLEPLAAGSQVVECLLRKVPAEVARRAEEEIRAGVDMTRRNFNELFAPGAYVLSRTRDSTHPAEILVLRLGPIALVGLPAEVFVENARATKHDSPFDPTLVIGLTGGAMGYLPHPQGYEQGGYEAGYRSARYDPSVPLLWIRTALALCNSVNSKLKT